MDHEWQIGRFTGARTCAQCGLLPLDSDDAATTCAIEAPVDSDAHPVAVLVQGDDLYLSECDDCRLRADDWPRVSASYSPDARPGAMFRGSLYCSIDMPIAWDPRTGERVDTLTGV